MSKSLFGFLKKKFKSKLYLFLLVVIAILGLIYYILFNKLLLNRALFPNDHLESMDLAAEWFIANQASDGSFPYQVNTFTGKSENNNDISRSAYGLYTLTLYYNHSKKPETKQTIIRSFQYFNKYILKKTLTYNTDFETGASLSYNGQEPTGATIALILALTEFGHNNPNYLSENKQLLHELGATLLNAQNPDGSFRTTPTKESSDAFINGQGVMGLMALYKQSNDIKYLNAAKKSAEYIMSKYRSSSELKSFYSWGVIGLYKLYQQDPDERYWVFIKDVTENLWDLELKYYDSYFKKQTVRPPVPYLAVYLEGLIHTADMASVKDPVFYKKLRDFIELSLDFQLKFQINGIYTNYHSSNRAFTGSFCLDYACKITQIDSTGHNLSSLYLYFYLLHKNHKPSIYSLF